MDDASAGSPGTFAAASIAARPAGLARSACSSLRPQSCARRTDWRARGLVRQRRQILDLVHARLEIELGEPLCVSPQRGLAFRGALAQGGERAVDTQVRKTCYASRLRVAHAGRIDLGIERLVPLRAFAHVRRAGLEVRG